MAASDVTRVSEVPRECYGCDDHEAHERMYMHSRCHSANPVWGYVTFGPPPTVTLECSVCRAHIVTFELEDT
jgi:hypothetical protein